MPRQTQMPTMMTIPTMPLQAVAVSVSRLLMG
jgi:hypothetical protein